MPKGIGRFISCEKCGFEVRFTVFKRHFLSCDGVGPMGRTWSIRKKGITTRKGVGGGWNRGLTKSDPRILEITNKNHRSGLYKAAAKRLSDWTAENRSTLVAIGKEAVRKGQVVGGYRDFAGRARRTGGSRFDFEGNRVWLQSSYELRCADALDCLRIFWIRPKPLSYTLAGRKRLYFPDFYLPALNLFLDPKNDYLIVKDQEKIQAVREQCKIRLLVLSEKDLKSLEQLSRGSCGRLQVYCLIVQLAGRLALNQSDVGSNPTEAANSIKTSP